MGKLVQPQLIKDFVTASEWTKLGSVDVCTYHFVFGDDDKKLFQNVFGEADCVSSYETDDDNHGMISRIVVTIDPRYNHESAYQYLVEALLRKLHPRNWKAFLKVDFDLDPFSKTGE